jgi:hypothetical protein
MGADAVVLAPGQLSGAIRRQLGSQVGLHRHLVEQGEVDLVELGTRLAGPDEPACELTQVADGVESPGQDNTARWDGTSRTATSQSTNARAGSPVSQFWRHLHAQ